MAELDGMSGGDIYNLFHSGSGGKALAGAADIAKTLVEDFLDSVESIKRLVATMEPAWQGEAAGAAERGAKPMMIAHQTALPKIDTAQDLTHRQVDSFDRAKSSLIPVPPAPTGPVPWPGFDRKWPDFVAYEQRVAAHNAASQHNVDVMTQYESDSDYNTVKMPTSFGSSIESDLAGVSVADPPSAPPQHPEPSPAPPPGPHGHGGRDIIAKSEKPAPGGQDPPAPWPAGDGTAPPQETRPDRYVPEAIPPDGPGVRLPGVNVDVTVVNSRLGGEFVGIGVVPAPENGSGGTGRGSGGGGPGEPGSGANDGGSSPRQVGAGPLSGRAPAGQGGVGRSGGVGSGVRGPGGGAPIGGVPGAQEGAEDIEHIRPEW